MDIKKLEYIIDQDQFYVQVQYQEGEIIEEEKISIKDAKTVIDKIKSDPKQREKFVGQHKIKFYQKEGNSLREITHEEYTKKYEKSLLKSNKKKTSSKSNIGKIVLYPTKDKEGVKKVNAVIFYTNGKMKEVSKEEAAKVVLKYAKANGITEYKKLFDDQIVEVSTERNLRENLETYRDQVIQSAKQNKKTPKPEKEKKHYIKKAWEKITTTLKENKVVKRISVATGMIATVIAIGISGYKLSHTSKTGDITLSLKNDAIEEVDDRPQDNIDRVIDSGLKDRENIEKENKNQEIQEEQQKNISSQETTSIKQEPTSVITVVAETQPEVQIEVPSVEIVNPNIDDQDSYPESTTSDYVFPDYSEEYQEANERLAEELNNWGLDTQNETEESNTNDIPLENTGIDVVNPEDVTDIIDASITYEEQAEQIVNDMANNPYEITETQSSYSR